MGYRNLAAEPAAGDDCGFAGTRAEGDVTTLFISTVGLEEVGGNIHQPQVWAVGN